MDEVLRTSGLTKRFNDVAAVDGVDLVVAAGERVALLGPNGAGKTTTILMILGVISPDAGWIEVAGQRLPRGRSASGVWHAIATTVMRRPLLVLVPTIALIAIAASPFVQLRLASADATILPPTIESRRGYDVLVNEFPGQDQSTITVVARFADDPLNHRSALDDLRARLAALPNVLRVDMPLSPTGPHIALLSVRTARTATPASRVPTSQTRPHPPRAARPPGTPPRTARPSRGSGGRRCPSPRRRRRRRRPPTPRDTRRGG